jgi:sulfide:quinone oxidoreductase
MKNIIILGAGTGGTMMANKLARHLNKNEYRITIVDKDENHYYQPGLLFIPFNIYKCSQVVKPKQQFIPSSVEFILSEVESIQPQKNRVKLTDKRSLDYDILIIATGTQIAPQETEGLNEQGWYQNIFDFYTFNGACALQKYLQNWQGGKLVVHIAEMPIKCPVAPLEFLFLADWWFGNKKMRDKVELSLITPLSGAFTKPMASEILGAILQYKNIKVIGDYSTSRIEPNKNKIFSWDELIVDYDVLVTVPVNMGDEAIAKSGLGDELNYVPTHKHTLQSKDYENIFVLGDATNLPSSKAGAVAHFEAEVLTDNIIRYIKNRPLEEGFDGHSNCFIESGYGKGFLIDFNYEVEPLQGNFPFPFIGPLPLLKESRLNHWAKMAFKWVYWNMLLKGYKLPIPTKMSRAGKRYGNKNI